MNEKITVNVPLNRVEGDLELQVEIQDGQVTNAWSSGTMFRGFEQIMVGRGARDGLVITPRVCGICGTSHLTAAARALDMIARVTPPPHAVKIRNVALMVEHIQNDLRQTFLMFTVDFTNPAYRSFPLYEEALRRFEPFKGKSCIDSIKRTKKILEIVAIIGGQWPHSSYMVPGGIVSVPSKGDLAQCRLLLKDFQDWYERRILGCSLDRWADIQSAADLNHWLEECEEHRSSDLGFFIRFARKIGLDTIGQGHRNFISYGAFDIPEETTVRPVHNGALLVPAGFMQGTRLDTFDQQLIAEHVAYSWFKDYEGGRHPSEGETFPYASGRESDKYSWAKAPRYNGLPAETGPLAEMLIAGDPLMTDLVERYGANVFTRQLARITRPVAFMPVMDSWLTETMQEGKFYHPPGDIVEGEGFGLSEGPRGALGHWVRIENSTIEHYQIVTPTTWNASPRDSNGIRGPWEEALIGTAVADPANPVELGHVVRSFDACLFCTVHLITDAQRTTSFIVSDMP